MAAALLATSMAAFANGTLEDQSLSQLEDRLEAIDAELGHLAHYSLSSGVGPIGYRSTPYTQALHQAWIQIDWENDRPLDQVVLVPAIWRDSESGFQSDGFPIAFQVRSGKVGDTQGALVAEFTSEDSILPRIAPLIIPTPGTTGAWVRVETSVLAPRAFDGLYVFQLSEILVFSGQENLALHRHATTSPNRLDGAEAWEVRYVTDGFVPYLMNSARGEQSTAYLSPVDVRPFGIGDHPALSIDLLQTSTLSRVHIHTVDQGDTVPQSAPDGIGLPNHFLLEGATQADFSDASPLLTFHRKSIYDSAPIMTWNLADAHCRYVRLTAIEPYIYRKGAVSGSRIGFAEIELFSGTVNVALGKPVFKNFQHDDPTRPLRKVTDGRNLYGSILPLRDWLHELARRHDLEAERPRVSAELSLRYARQKINLRRMIWLAVFLAVGIGFTFLLDRIVRMRQVVRLKQRFAADLHDELGANLHTIGLLSDLAEGAKENPEELSMLHQRIRAVTERTGTALRNCSDLLEARGLYTGLVSDMQRASDRILANLQHDLILEGEEHLAQLKRRTRVDLFLFYKECLVNISRHAQATQFSTCLSATRKELHLSIRDNGRGMPGSIPASLKRRARLLGATTAIDTPPEGGSCISLRLSLRGRVNRDGRAERNGSKANQQKDPL